MEKLFKRLWTAVDPDVRYEPVPLQDCRANLGALGSSGTGCSGTQPSHIELGVWGVGFGVEPGGGRFIENCRSLNLAVGRGRRRSRVIELLRSLQLPTCCGRRRSCAGIGFGVEGQGLRVPHDGLRPSHQKPTCITQLTVGPHVVQIW